MSCSGNPNDGMTAWFNPFVITWKSKVILGRFLGKS